MAATKKSDQLKEMQGEVQRACQAIQERIERAAKAVRDQLGL